MSDLDATIERIYREDSRRVFATLARQLGDFDRAEEALHEAFAAAVAQWPVQGIPDNPRAWLVSTGRFKWIDAIRRKARLDGSLDVVVKRMDEVAQANAARDEIEIEDDRLRLIFTCCHPAIDPAIQVALTLREVCGLTTPEIAAAFLTASATMAQRIVRGKAKIRAAAIPIAIPAADDLPGRLDSVLAVVYLVFNEGYSASSGDAVTKADLSAEAIRLSRLVVELLPDPEAIGLLALMLLQDSRRAARTSAAGELVLLHEQDRSLWNSNQIREGQELVKRAMSGGRLGPYTLQAAIAAEHAGAETAAATDWPRIVDLYDALFSLTPSPVVELNRAAALAMRDGPAAGLEAIDAILARGELAQYHLAHAARADLLRRLGRTEAARDAYIQALSLTNQGPERRFLQQRLDRL